MAYDHTMTRKFIEEDWGHEGRVGDALAALMKFVEIPNLSPAFDSDWAERGDTDRAAEHIVASIEALKDLWAARGARVDDITAEVVGGAGAPEMDGAVRRTPLVLIQIPAQGLGSSHGTAILYGHLDKQPHLDPALWGDTHPTRPVIKDGRLYGRGSADDGWAVYGAFSAVMSLRAQGAPHAAASIVIEAAEESGSEGFMHYIDHLASRLGDVSLIVCLDSEAATYDRLWTTSSLRGVVSGTLTVKVLDAGVHSGLASGIVPSSFRITRMLLSRIEDESTGEITPSSLRAHIPQSVRDDACAVARLLGDEIYRQFPFASERSAPARDDTAELILSQTRRAQLSIIGIEGLPDPGDAGNVLRPYTSTRLSLRLPPTIDANEAAASMERILEADPPYGAVVSFDDIGAGEGWAEGELPDWFSGALETGSRESFGADPLKLGIGGSIPIMSALARKYPRAVFMITGASGPGTNAHGPRESLHLAAAKNVIACVARVVASHAEAGA